MWDGRWGLLSEEMETYPALVRRAEGKVLMIERAQRLVFVSSL
jgi:hypothetical protein